MKSIFMIFAFLLIAVLHDSNSMPTESSTTAESERMERAADDQCDWPHPCYKEVNKRSPVEIERMERAADDQCDTQGHACFKQVNKRSPDEPQTDEAMLLVIPLPDHEK